jgi:acetyl esterase
MPALAALEGLCPTVIINAEYDELRASGQAFAAALAVAGVDVRQVTIRGLLHAFLNLSADIEPVGRCLDLLADVVAHQHNEYAASSASSSRPHAVAT